MSVIFLLIPLSIVTAAVFLGGFIWAVRSGQYEDTCTPSMRLLTDDSEVTSVKGPTSPGAKNDQGSLSRESGEKAPKTISGQKKTI
jgi:cbb3-type cytochrome oxidase maturation protein